METTVALIIARLDYDCVAYWSESLAIAVIQARALRVCIGAVRIAPMSALKKCHCVNAENRYWLTIIINRRGHEDNNSTKKF